MKSALRILLAALFVASFVVACGGDSGTDDTKKDTVNNEDTAQKTDTVEGVDTLPEDTIPEGDAEPGVDTIVCEPTCAAEDGTLFECGDDGCNGTCGTCAAGDQYSCVDNMCVCTPQCDGKECGPDMCGGQCGTCADGTSCGSDSKCHEGCDAPTFSDVAVKVNALAIGDGGLPGMALDVDEDAATCAPAANCSDGLDNSLGGILSQLSAYVDVQEQLDKALSDGAVMLLGEMVDATFAGAEFTMNMYLGDVVDAGCDFQTANCAYTVKAESFDVATCLPVIAFDNATINGTDFAAGGPGYKFGVSVPIQEGVILTVTAHNAKIEGTVTVDGTAVTAMEAIVGGAIPKQLIMDAVDMLPEDLELPVSKEVIKSMLKMFLVVDIDLNGDGQLTDEDDGISLGVQFGAIQGSITGMTAGE